MRGDDLIQKIKQSINCISIFRRFYPQNYREHGNSLCPFHADKGESLLVNDSERVHCFGCNCDKDVIDIYEFATGYTKAQAIAALADELGISRQEGSSYSAGRGAAKPRDDRDAATLPEIEKKWLHFSGQPLPPAARAYLEEERGLRGILDSGLPLGYSRNRDSIVVPMYSWDGKEFFGMQHIPVGGGKKLFEKGSKAKFGFHRFGNSYEPAYDGDYQVITGAAIDAWSAWCACHISMNITVATIFSEGDYKKLANIATPVTPILFLDKDFIGYYDTIMALLHLGIGKISVVDWNLAPQGHKDVNDLLKSGPGNAIQQMVKGALAFRDEAEMFGFIERSIGEMEDFERNIEQEKVFDGLKKKVAKAFKKIKTKSRGLIGKSEAYPDMRSRPTIKTSGGRLTEEIDEAEKILADCDPPVLFQRSGQLVKICEMPMMDEDFQRDEHALIVKDAGDAYVRERMNQCASWLKYDKRANEWMPINCSKDHAQTYCARNAWRVPSFSGITLCPTLRPNGSLLSTPGFDRQTGIFVAGNLNIDIPENPTRDDALAALAVLRTPLEEFPFASLEDEAVILSGIISAVIRKAMPGAPIIGIKSHTPGSGKGLLARVISITATGFSPTIIHQSLQDGEFDKRFAATAMAGDPVVSIDNCEHPVGGESLCTAITEGMFAPRKLGESLNIPCRTRNTYIATGNNLVFSGDMDRRVICCVIDAGMERPEEREFKRDLVEWMGAHRRDMIQAALTIVKAYLAAGKPSTGLKPVGSFERWCAWVRDPLVWLGAGNAWETNKRIRGADPVMQHLRSFMTLWSQLFGEKKLTTSQIVLESNPRSSLMVDDMEQERAEFRGLLVAMSGDGKDAINTKKLSNFLRKNSDRVLGGLHIVSFDDAHLKVKTYSVLIPQPFSHTQSQSTNSCGIVRDSIPYPHEQSVSFNNACGDNDNNIHNDTSYRRGGHETPRNTAKNVKPKRGADLTCGIARVKCKVCAGRAEGWCGEWGDYGIETLHPCDNYRKQEENQTIN